MTKKNKITITSLVLIFSIILRFINIDWGVPLSRAHNPSHPDELMAMSILNQINTEKKDYIPEEAHIEGSFNYYLWKFYLSILSKIKILNFPVNQIGLSTTNNHYGQALLASKILTATFSSLSVILMYIILSNFNIPYIPKIISLSLYGSNLIEIVYGHFMRPHTLSNFLLLLVIYFTFNKKYQNNFHRYIITGILCGLTQATRYNNCAIIIPIFYQFMLFLKDKKRDILLYGCISTTLFFLIGFFIGDPAIFTNFKEVEPYLKYQLTFLDKKQFSNQYILDTSRIKTYLTYLIPFASFPTSWIIIYFFLLISPFYKKIKLITIPLFVFVIIYSYIMAKGYSIPIFSRATLPVFPPMIIITALSFKCFWKHKKLHRLIVILSILLLIPSVLFATTYVIGMTPTHDPRNQLLNYFSNVNTNLPISLYSQECSLCDYYLQGSLHYSNKPKFNFLTTQTYPPVLNSYYISCVLYPKAQYRTIDIENVTVTSTINNEIPIFAKFNLNQYLPADLAYPYFSFKIYRN